MFSNLNLVRARNGLIQLSPVVLLFFSGKASSNPAPDSNPGVQDYLRFLGSANSYSPAEGAGSHGSIGIGLGVGASKQQKPENSPLTDDQLRNPNDFNNKDATAQNDTIVIPRAFFHKGTPWPIDFGFGLGRVSNLKASTAGGYAQWTLYEAFAMPAVALRLKHSRLMGLPSTEFNSSAIEGALSYGFLRYFTAYGTYAFNQHNAVIRTSGETGTSLALDDSPNSDFSTTIKDHSRTIGLQVQLLPPFCNVAIESRVDSEMPSYLAKVSLGL